MEWNICRPHDDIKVSNGAKIRNRYNQVPHLTQDDIKPIRLYYLISHIFI